MKVFAPIISVLFLSLATGAKANLPRLRTLEEKVESAKYLFTGVAEKVKVKKIQTSDIYPATNNASRNSPPVPSVPYRLIEFEVRITEVLKNSGRQLPKKMRLKLVRAFLSQQDIQQEITAINAAFPGREQVYLVERVDLFSTEAIAQKSQIKRLIQLARVKVRPTAIKC